MRFVPCRARTLAHALLFSTILSPTVAAEFATGPAPASNLPVPPAPDRNAAPEAYDHWQKFVATPFSKGWIKSGQPLPRTTNSAPSPARLGDPGPAPVGDAKSGTGHAEPTVVKRNSLNWSGAVYHDKEQQPFKIEAIVGEFVVPTARQPLGVCDSRHSSYWVGIDGYGSHMLLQAGLSARSECKNGVETPHYSAWIEWLPTSSVTVSRPEVRPGDLIFIEVWSVTTLRGFAYIYNHSLRQGAVYALTPASPADALKGGSVEWIVERPTRDRVYEKLINYSAVSMPFGVAWNYRSTAPDYYYPGAPPETSNFDTPPETLHILTMLDDNKKIISTPTVENNHFLFFQNSGSSASGDK